MTGNWSALQMQQVARSYLAYYLTGSFAALGYIELANSLPRLLLALVGGVVADRASRRVIIQVGQTATAFVAGAIAALLFADALKIEHLVIAAVGQGILNSFVMPARQAMIPEIVGPSRLTNAFALNVFALNVLRLGAPAAAGILIAAFGASWVFVVMVIMNLFAVATLFPVPKITALTRAAGTRMAPQAVRSGHGRGHGRVGLGDIVDGFAYLNRERLLFWLIFIHGTTQMFTLPYQRLLPGFIDEVLASSESQTALLTGLLLSFTAVGALAGSLMIASLPDRNRGRLLAISLFVFGAALIAFSASTFLWLSAAFVVVLGFGQSMRQSIANILVQSRVEEAYRGRVSSIMLMEEALESFGIFAIAIFADLAGSQWALGSVGGVLLLYALGLRANRTLRNLQ